MKGPGDTTQLAGQSSSLHSRTKLNNPLKEVRFKEWKTPKKNQAGILHRISSPSKLAPFRKVCALAPVSFIGSEVSYCFE